MPQVPFPKQISKPVVLVRRTSHERLAGVLLGATILTIAIVGGVTAWDRGVLGALQDRLQFGDIAQPDVQVRGASVPTERLLAALDTFAVVPEDLPASLATFSLSEDETGAVDAMLARQPTEQAQQTVFVGAAPLDVFQSDAYLFATSAGAARAFLLSGTDDELANIVGQRVEQVVPITAGQGGFVFRAPGPGTSDGHIFSGAIVLFGRVVHVVMGYLPAAVTDADIATLAAESIARYEDVVEEQFDNSTRDRDDDGLTDSVEESLGTNPAAADSDADGFDDRTEVLGGYDPIGSGMQADADALLNIPGWTL